MPRNRNSAQFTTFLRLAIVASSFNRGSRRKHAGNWSSSFPFSLYGNGRELLIEKKVAKKPRFLFSGWLDCRNRANPAKSAQNPQRERQNPSEGNGVNPERATNPSECCKPPASAFHSSEGNGVNPAKEGCGQGWMCFCLYSRKADKT